MQDMGVLEEIDECGEFVLACSFKDIEDGFSSTFVGLYGPNFDCDKRYLWVELVGLLSQGNLLWCIGADFNVALFL